MCITKFAMYEVLYKHAKILNKNKIQNGCRYLGFLHNSNNSAAD